MSRKFSKTKCTAAAITAVLCVSAFSGCSNPLESIQSMFSQTTTTAAAVTAETTAETTAAADEEAAPETAEEYADAAGGNAVEVIENSIEVTVLEDKYLYGNTEKSLDEIIGIIESAEDLSAVIIYDQDATLTAYKALTDSLDEKGISYLDEKE